MLQESNTRVVQAARTSPDVMQQFALMDVGDRPLHEVLHAVARLAASTVPDVDQASIILVDVVDKTTTVAFTGSLVAALDERQYGVGFGPGLAAAHSGGVVRIDDTSAEAAYPDFAAIARRAGVSSVLAVSLPMPARVLGALTLYRVNAQDPISTAAQTTAASFAVYAGVALANASQLANRERVITHLHTAMRTREVIDQAKGILMARAACDADAAFHLLSRQSQRSNRKVRDLAVDIVTAVAEGRPLDML